MRTKTHKNDPTKVPRSKGVLCSLGTDGQTDTKVKTEDTLSGFQDFFQIFLQPIIKERSNKYYALNSFVYEFVNACNLKKLIMY